MNDQPQMMSQAQIMAAMSQQQPPLMMMSQIGQPSQPPPPAMMMPNQSQPLPMMNRAGGYKAWPQQQQQPNFPGRNNWKGKKGPPIGGAGVASGGGYKPPTLQELQSLNRQKARKYYQKKKHNNRFAPYAPRNTTSFIIRAKRSGGITSLVSPCPVTPAVLPTPIFSPSREVLGDMAKEEWGVDGYGSMKGLIRLRSPGNDEEEEEGGGGSSESDVEEHVEVERRLDHDLSRFEMIYPNYNGMEYNNVLENRVDDQDSHISQLEEENLTLKERLFLMEREMGDMRRRLLCLERQSRVIGEVHEEVVENESENENESEGGSGAPGTSGKNNEEVGEYTSSGQDGTVRDVDMDAKNENGNREDGEGSEQPREEEGRSLCAGHDEKDDVSRDVKTEGEEMEEEEGARASS